jgi:hypothetical protein
MTSAFGETRTSARVSRGRRNWKRESFGPQKVANLATPFVMSQEGENASDGKKSIVQKVTTVGSLSRHGRMSSSKDWRKVNVARSLSG